jgi:hypothetical protein
MQFIVTATGPNGVYWLSKPSEFGLRTLVARQQADRFPTLEAAEHAIKEMPTGYKLARISFAIDLCGDLRVAPAQQSADYVTPPDEPV